MYRRTTHDQMQCYADFLEQHPKLGKEEGDSIALWSQLAKRLNRLRGPKRTPIKWRSAMMNIKKQKEFRKRKSTSSSGLPVCNVNNTQEGAFNDVDLNDENEKDTFSLNFDAMVVVHDLFKGYSTTDDIDTMSERTRSTQEQLQCFKRFCREHPQFQLTKESINENGQLWDELVTQLNALTGPKRTIPKWLEHLRSWQSQINFRARQDMDPLTKPTKDVIPDVETPLQILEVVSMNEKPVQNTPTQLEAQNDLNVETDALADMPFENCDTLLHDVDIKLENDEVADPIDPQEPQATEPKSTKRSNHGAVLRQILQSMKKREHSDEIAMRQHKETTTALEQLNSTLILMNETLKKINQKLDKL